MKHYLLTAVVLGALAIGLAGCSKSDDTATDTSANATSNSAAATSNAAPAPGGTPGKGG